MTGLEAAVPHEQTPASTPSSAPASAATSASASAPGNTDGGVNLNHLLHESDRYIRALQRQVSLLVGRSVGRQACVTSTSGHVIGPSVGS